MTKYILHGGEAGRQTIENRNFFAEMANGLLGTVNVLSVLFARDKAIWNEKFKEDKKNFSSASPEKIFKFSLASDKIDTFIEQINNADIVYLKGGDSHLLQQHLEKIPNLGSLFSGKVISGVSAGAIVLSQFYYNNDDDTYNKGLGILPIKTFCHYTEDKSEKLEKLKKFGIDLRIYTIPEEKFFIIEK